MRPAALALAALLAAAAPIPAAAEPRLYIVGLPADDPAPAEPIWARLLGLLLRDAGPGDRIRVYDAAAVRLLAEARIAPRAALATEARRRRDLAPVVETLRAHLRGLAAAVPEAGEPATLRLPQFLTELGTTGLAGPETCILVLGNALHADPREPDFDMTGGRFPTDGHILATRTVSPFGTADRQGLLRGANVHLVWRNADWHSDLHLDRVHRFWALFVAGMGGSLATFTGDEATGFERFRACTAGTATAPAFDETADRVGMLAIVRELSEPLPGPVTLPPMAPAPAEAPAQAPATPRAQEIPWLEAPAPRAPAPSSPVGTLQVGIRWGDRSCAGSDLDLYVRADPALPFLHFALTRTAEGQYHKDWRSAPATRNGLEYVDFLRPTDIRRLEIRVNFYAGRCPGGVEGVVRARLDGVTHELPFRLAAETGNGGAAFHAAATSPHWVVIDTSALFGLGD